MNAQGRFSIRRLAAVVLVIAGLGGCVYAPPDGTYDATYAGYRYPTYVGPPVTLDLGFFFSDHHHGHYRGHHGHYRGHHYGHYRGHHGWRSHGRGHHGWRSHGGGHHRGGWHGSRGRH